jgi:hypothetical protein
MGFTPGHSSRQEALEFSTTCLHLAYYCWSEKEQFLPSDRKISPQLTDGHTAKHAASLQTPVGISG